MGGIIVRPPQKKVEVVVVVVVVEVWGGVRLWPLSADPLFHLDVIVIVTGGVQKKGFHTPSTSEKMKNGRLFHFT